MEECEESISDLIATASISFCADVVLYPYFESAWYVITSNRNDFDYPSLATVADLGELQLFSCDHTSTLLTFAQLSKMTWKNPVPSRRRRQR